MVTTIKIHEDTKQHLDVIKQKRESYDDTIQRILLIESKRKLSEQLIQGYKSMTTKEFDEFKEWDQI